MAGLFSFAACPPASPPRSRRGGVCVERGLAYGPLARHRLDLAALAPDAPSLLFIHGGAWTSGSRVEYGFVALPLAQSGALAAVADDRLPTPLTKSEAQGAWSLPDRHIDNRTPRITPDASWIERPRPSATC